jgi:hypothetical protein
VPKVNFLRTLKERQRLKQRPQTLKHRIENLNPVSLLQTHAVNYCIARSKAKKPEFLKEPPKHKFSEFRKAQTLVSLRSKGRNANVSNRTSLLASKPYIKVLVNDLSPLAVVAKRGYDAYLLSDWKNLWKSIRVFYKALSDMKRFKPTQVGFAWYLDAKKFLRLNISRLRKLRNFVHDCRHYSATNPP